MRTGEAQAVERLGAGGDILGGEVGLVGRGRQQRGDVRDGGAVAAGGVLGRVGDRRRKQAAQRVGDLVVGGAVEDEGGAGWVGGLCVH